jgi:hypothetical protein
MQRTITGGGIGVLLGLLALAGWGLYDGLTQGLPTAHIAPVIEAGAKSAFVYMVYLFPFAFVLGVVGALAGFASWIVKPRPSAINGDRASTATTFDPESSA